MIFIDDVNSVEIKIIGTTQKDTNFTMLFERKERASLDAEKRTLSATFKPGINVKIDTSEIYCKGQKLTSKHFPEIVMTPKDTLMVEWGNNQIEDVLQIVEKENILFNPDGRIISFIETLEG